ncbi:MAG: serine/threonine-protein kinase [Candidatus Gracilibacteria bacterium]|nr:serine/threonine-protein kinase [Candidatus Gracilibacteria bacterium]
MNTRPDNEHPPNQEMSQKVYHALRKLAEFKHPQLHRVILNVQQGVFTEDDMKVLTFYWTASKAYHPYIKEVLPYLHILKEKAKRKMLKQGPPPTPKAYVEVRNEITSLFQTPERMTTLLASHLKAKGFDQLRFLAKGGMGAVYEANSSRLSRPCVIKISLSTDNIKMVQAFEKEAKMAAQVSKHPAIVEIYDAGTLHIVGQAVNYYVMEHIDGGDAHELIGHIQNNEMEVEMSTRLELLRNIANGLEVIHRQGMTHRDMKPANVLIDKFDGTLIAKISDFGLASARYMKHSPAEVMNGTEDSMESLTYGGAVIGTPSFMPEEAWRDPQSAGSAWDIHALGLIAAELLTGHSKMQEFTFKRKFGCGRDYGVAYMMTNFQSAISYDDPGLDALRESTEDEEILKFLCQMTSRNAQKRPSATEVVSFFHEQLKNRSDEAMQMRSLKRKMAKLFAGTAGIIGLSTLLYFATKRPEDHIHYARELENRSTLATKILTTNGPLSSEVLKNLIIDLQQTLEKKKTLKGFESEANETHPAELEKLIQTARAASQAQKSLDKARLLQKDGKHVRCIDSLSKVYKTAPESFKNHIIEIINSSRYEIAIKNYHYGDTEEFIKHLNHLEIRQFNGLSGKKKRELNRLKNYVDLWETRHKKNDDDVFLVLGWTSHETQVVKKPQLVLQKLQKWVSEAQFGDSDALYKALTMYNQLLEYATKAQKNLNRQDMNRLLQTDAKYASIARLVPQCRKILIKVLAEFETGVDNIPGLRMRYQLLSMEMISYYQSILYTRLNTPNLPDGIYRGLIDRAVPLFTLILSLQKNLSTGNTLGADARITLKKSAQDTYRKIEGEVPREFTKPVVDLLKKNEKLRELLKK